MCNINEENKDIFTSLVRVKGNNKYKKKQFYVYLRHN